MKKKTLAIVLAAILVLVIVTVGVILLFAGKKDKNPLLGTWANGVDDIYNAAWTFSENGKVNMKSNYAEGNGTYTIDGDKVTVVLDIWDKEKVYQFSIENDKLTLTATDLYSPGYKELTKTK